MNEKVLLRGGILVSLEPLRLEQKDLLVVDGHIVRREERIPTTRDVRVVDCRRRFVLPGFVNTHARLHAPLRNLVASLSGPTDLLEYREIESAFTRETLITSVFAGALEALRYGTTCVFDRSASPACPEGSLDLVRDAILTVGPRVILAYDEGDDPSVAELARGENRAFARDNRSDRARGVMGLANLTALDPDDLASFADDARRHGLSLTLDVSEDEDRLVRERFGMSAIAFLAENGLLDGNTVLVHGVRRTEEELTLVREKGAWLAYCPTSSARHGFPSLPFEILGERVVLGSDSSASNMFAEARAAWLAARARHAAARPEDIIEMIVSGHQLASERLGIELGSTRRDAVADLIIMDYYPRASLHDDNLASHILFGMNETDIREVLVDGDVVYRNGHYPNVDIQKLAPLIREGSDELARVLAGEAVVAGET